MGKVFISYSHKDKDWAKDYLLTNLEKQDIKCHIDFRDFEIGVPSIINMERAVETCEKTILVFTPNWVESEFSQFEGVMLQTESPLNLKKRILPLMLQASDIPKRLKILTYANFKDENEWDFQLERLIKQIKKDFGILKPEKIEYPPLDIKNIHSRLPQTGFELFGRQEELKLLNKAWESDKVNVMSLVAYGGVGKSTLVNKWLEKMRWDNYRGAEKIFAWSFYSQGTNEYVTSADMFINYALKWFGDKNPEQGSAWNKGKRLAKLISENKALLILDGLEPLQSGLDVEKGKIKDPALTMLITDLAKHNKGLCIITTRERIPELDRYTKTSKQENLERISDEAGRKLLELRGVLGSENELNKTVNEFGNHALAINLLAEYLHQFPGHPVHKAFEIPDINIPVKKGKYPRRIIEAFAEQFSESRPEFELLSVLGLFDRPAEKDAIDLIINDTPIPGLTHNLSKIKGDEWHNLLDNLRKYKLISKKSEHRPDTLDCHPLIREHFGEKLEQQNPDAWKQAHARLYEYYKNKPKKELPDTLEEMEPLFAAVTHGCLAGKHQEAFIEIWWKRTKRGKEHYSTKKLGAFGADLSCLSSFFETLWNKPASGLTEPDKAITLSWAGVVLRAVGRLSEAVQPMKASLEIATSNKNWKTAAIRASNLSELYLTLGEVASAQKYGAQCVTLADRSGDDHEMESKRTTHADALQQAGKNKTAEKLFIEAENMQKKRQPVFPCLYSLWGFRFCGLLLSKGKYQKVLERARTTLTYQKFSAYTPLDIALDKLTISKALMLQTVTSPSVPSSIESGTGSQDGIRGGCFSEAEDYLNQAVDGLREAGTQDQLPRGLFARATLSRHQKDFLKSWGDLDEAREIAEYGQMRLHLTDYHLEACRNIRIQLANKDYQIIENGETLRRNKDEMQARFQEHLKEAEKLINETGYHRRDGELEELRKSIQ